MAPQYFKNQLKGPLNNVCFISTLGCNFRTDTTKRKRKKSRNVTNGKKTLAVRFPKNLITKNLLSSLDYPLAAPSANIYTQLSPISKKDVKEEFGKKIKFILDGGSSEIGLESTIISLVNNPKILRLGSIDVKKISKILKKKIKYSKNKKISVPGQSKFLSLIHI